MILTLEVVGEQAEDLGASGRKVFHAVGGTIGRLPDNDWVFPDPYVSGRHALIRYLSGKFFVEDTSTNGVFLNSPDNRLPKSQPQVLKDGDLLYIDAYRIAVAIESEAAITSENVDTMAMRKGKSAPAAAAPSVAPPPKSAPLAPRAPVAPVAPAAPSALPPRSPPRNVPAASETVFLPPEDDHTVGMSVPVADQNTEWFGISNAPAADNQKTEWFGPGGVGSQPEPPAPARQRISPQRPAAAPARAAVPAKPAPPLDDRKTQWFGVSNAPAADEHKTQWLEPGNVEAQAEPPPPVRPRIPPTQTPAAAQAPPVAAKSAPPAPSAPPMKPAPSITERPAPPRVAPVEATAPAARERTGESTPARAAAGARSEDVLMKELLAAAGIVGVEPSHELAQTVGEILRVAVAGLMEVQRARERMKDELRVRGTIFKPAQNNPLKFSANVEDAFHNLLLKHNPAYLDPKQAFADALHDVRDHHTAILAALRLAFESMLAQFDPNRMQEEFDRQMKKGSILGVPVKLRYWDLYRDKYGDMVKDADTSFRHLFGDKFAVAYEEQLERLKSQNREREK